MSEQKVKKSPEVKALEDLLREAECGRRNAERLFTEIHDMVISVIGPHTNALDAYKIGPMREKLQARITAGDAAIAEVHQLQAEQLVIKCLRATADGDADTTNFRLDVERLEEIVQYGNMSDGMITVVQNLRTIADKHVSKEIDMGPPQGKEVW